MADKSQDTAHYESAGPTLLSEQPADPTPTKASPDEVKKWSVLRSHLEARLVSMRMWRQSWWTQNYSDLAQYIEPRRSIWLTQSTGGMPSPNNMTRGKPINTSIVDPTATYAVRVCSSGLMSGLASPSRPWFKITPSLKGFQPDEEGRAWLDEVEDRIYTVLAGSNFYNSFAQECEDLVVFGTSPCIIYEDETDILRCYNPVVGEYYLSSGATLRVDGLYRTFVMTVAQIVDFFGADNCPEDIMELWKAKGSSLEMERIVAHSIEPNFAVSGSADAGKLPGKFTWREVYWLYGSGSVTPLSMKGYVDQPFTASRWSTQSNDAYGRSPGMDVLPDVIQLQVETMRKAEAIEKMVRPPLLADMQLKNQPSSILPGHVTYVSNLGTGTGMRSIYDVNPDIAAMMNDLAAIQARIKLGFFNDLFLMMQQPSPQMTATEVSAKLSEKLQVLGPVIEGLITESLKPKLKRVYGIMTRKGLIPPTPDSMKGVPLDITFVSMLALAQKAAATGGLERIAGLIGNLVPVFPEAKDLLDTDTYIREMNDLLGNPQKILFAPDQVAKTRQAHDQQLAQMQQQQDLANGVQTANVGAQAAQVLSQTQVGSGQTALNQILGTGGGGQ